MKMSAIARKFVEVKKFWSLVEQFGGTAILFLLLPVVARFIGVDGIGMYFLTQTIVAISTIYSGAAVLKTKYLKSKSNASYDLLGEFKNSFAYVLFITPLATAYIYSFSEIFSNSATEIACYTLDIALIIWIDIQCATLITLLRARGDFIFTGTVEVFSKISLVIFLISLFALRIDILWIGPLSITAIQALRFFMLVAIINFKYSIRRSWNNQKILFDRSHLMVLGYGIISFLVANGERLFGGILGLSDIAAVFSITMVPAVIPSIINAIRITGMFRGTKSGSDAKSSMIKNTMFDVALALVVGSLAIKFNPLYYKKIITEESGIDFNLINVLACAAVIIQSANISAFYSLVVNRPESVAKIVVFSGLLYFVIGTWLVPDYGLYGLMYAKIVFYIAVLLIVPVSIMTRNENGKNKMSIL